MKKIYSLLLGAVAVLSACHEPEYVSPTAGATRANQPDGNLHFRTIHQSDNGKTVGDGRIY